MTPTLRLTLALILIVSAAPAFGLMSLEYVTRERAKELGMVVRTVQPGPESTRVELEFKTDGLLKDYSRVDLETQDGGLYVTLKEETSAAGHVVVGFYTSRANLDNISLKVVLRQGPRSLDALVVRIKDFVNLPPAAAPAAPAAPAVPSATVRPAAIPPAAAPATPAPATPALGGPAPGAATPAEEARFLAAVRKAFTDHDASLLDALTCTDGVPEKIKQSSHVTFSHLVSEASVSFDFTLVDPDRNIVGREHVIDGTTYRFNRPITRQLNMTGRHPTDHRILMVLSHPVGEKEGKLMLLGSTPVK